MQQKRTETQRVNYYNITSDVKAAVKIFLLELLKILFFVKFFFFSFGILMDPLNRLWGEISKSHP